MNDQPVRNIGYSLGMKLVRLIVRLLLIVGLFVGLGVITLLAIQIGATPVGDGVSGGGIQIIGWMIIGVFVGGGAYWIKFYREKIFPAVMSRIGKKVGANRRFAPTWSLAFFANAAPACHIHCRAR